MGRRVDLYPPPPYRPEMAIINNFGIVEFDYGGKGIMTTRGLVKELLIAYLNSRRLNHVSIAEFRNTYKAQLPKVDIYRIVYGLGLNDPEFRIEKDEDTTYIVMG